MYHVLINDRLRAILPWSWS